MLARQDIDQIARTVAEKFEPERIVLFGSYARGDADENSDLDILVVTREPGPRGRRSAPIIKLLAQMYDAPVDVVVRSSEAFERWKHAPGTLAHQIEIEGVTLYEKPKRRPRRLVRESG